MILSKRRPTFISRLFLDCTLYKAKVKVSYSKMIERSLACANV
ncbi:hypothetical protein I656_01661 [Geobacillus sp. WSUCF1]|nr:hypothetical protein I656_01661 [Geobacillus sp. WSUCF1]